MATEQPQSLEELLHEVEELLRTALRLLAETEEALTRAKAVAEKSQQRLDEVLPDEKSGSQSSGVGKGGV